MAPVLHIMRHGQGYHSPAVTKDGHLIRDPYLTELGKEQCQKRSVAFNRHDQIELLMASPLRRALQTCELTFAPCIQRGLRIMAYPHAEEVSTTPSDTGSPRQALKAEFDGDVDFSLVRSEDWYKREGEFTSDPKLVNMRATHLRKFIKARPEKEVALVSHGFFNHFVTGEVDDQGQQTTPWWGETELRTYEFVEGDEEGAMLKETDASLMYRGGMLENGVVKLNDPSQRGKSE